MSARHPAEPWRIKMVERLPVTTRPQRQRALEAAGYNISLLRRLVAMVVSIMSRQMSTALRQQLDVACRRKGPGGEGSEPVRSYRSAEAADVTRPNRRT